MTLSPGVQRVRDALEKHGDNFRIREMPSSTRTAGEAAESIGCQLGQIVKSLVFRGRESRKPLLVLVSGTNRVDESKLADEVGEQLEKADAGFVKQVTGFAIGGVPPLAHAQAIDTYIDRDLLQYREVWAAAGAPNAVFCLESEQLVRFTEGRLVTVK